MERTGKKDDVYWIQEFRQGDSLAFAYFYKRYYQRLHYFANRLIQDDQESNDIISKCFAKLWEKRSDFNTSENIKAYLYISCRHTCLTYLRDVKNRTAAQELYFDHLNKSENSVLNEVIQAEFLQILDNEINLLPEMCQRVFRLLYFEGKKTDEIAAQLGLSVQTVRNYKTRAIEKLKTSFLKKGITRPFFLAFLLFIDNL